MKIQITNDHAALQRIGGGEYADKHADKEYTAEIGADGWATVDRVAKFDRKLHPANNGRAAT